MNHPSPHYQYDQKFAPAALAADYAGWGFIERGFDEHGLFVTIDRDGLQYLLRGRIGDEWIAQNMTDEQIVELL